MHLTHFLTKRAINNSFLINFPVSDEVEDAMFNDPFYGLKNYLNYPHWQNLIYTQDETKLQMQRVFKWELATYFGLTFDQIQEA